MTGRTESAQNNKRTPGKTPCVPDDAGGRSLPWQGGWFMKWAKELKRASKTGYAWNTSVKSQAIFCKDVIRCWRWKVYFDNQRCRENSFPHMSSLTLILNYSMLTIINKLKDNGLIAQVIGPDRAHNLFIRTRAKNGFKLALTNFKISELELQGGLRSRGLITLRSLVQIQPPLPNPSRFTSIFTCCRCEIDISCWGKGITPKPTISTSQKSS